MFEASEFVAGLPNLPGVYRFLNAAGRGGSVGEGRPLTNTRPPNLIKSLQPRYNVLFRDDKSYGYILVTGHEYPQIRFYRGAHVKGNRYFGPFPSAWSVRETIGHLQKIFLLRTCDDTV